MPWIRFPNHKIWYMDAHGQIDGVVDIPDFAEMPDEQRRLDALTDAVTGSVVDLEACRYDAREDGAIVFVANARNTLRQDDDTVVVPPEQFLSALARQYGIPLHQMQSFVGNLQKAWSELAPRR